MLEFPHHLADRRNSVIWLFDEILDIRGKAAHAIFSYPNIPSSQSPILPLLARRSAASFENLGGLSKIRSLF